MAIYDIRMEDDDDSSDISGLLFAKNQDTNHLPKIILAANPTYEHVRELMGRTESPLPAVVDFVGKSEGFDALVKSLKDAFSKTVQINETLKVHWDSPNFTSFKQIAGMLIAATTSNHLPDMAEELEDLFRKMFFEFEQITINREIWHSNNMICMEVSAFLKGVEKVFLITIGPKTSLDDEENRIRKALPENFTDLRLEGTVYTLHFAALQISYPGTNLSEAIPFNLFFYRETDKTLRNVIHDYCLKIIEARQTNLQILDTVLQKKPSPITNFTSPEKWEEIITIFQHEAKVQLGLDISKNDHTFKITFSNGKKIVFTDPIDFYSKAGTISESDMLVESLGKHRIETLLATLQQILPTDFRNTAFASPLYDFSCFENMLRFETTSPENFLSLLEFEQSLLKPVSLSENINLSNVEPEYRRTLNAILSIRQTIAEKSSFDLYSYFHSLWIEILPNLTEINPDEALTKRLVKRWLHQLIFTGLMCTYLEQQKHTNTKPSQTQKRKLTINEAKHEIYIGDTSVSLTSLEFKILAFLNQRKGLLCSHTIIIQEVFGEEMINQETEKSRLTTNIMRIRKKIEPDPKNPTYLLTVQGEGYRLEDEG